MKIDRDRALEIRLGIARNEAVLSSIQFGIPIRHAILAIVLAPLTLGLSLFWFPLRERRVGVVTNKRVVVLDLRGGHRRGLVFSHVESVESIGSVFPNQGTVILHRPNGDPMVLRDVVDPVGVRDRIRAAIDAAVASGKILHPIF